MKIEARNINYIYNVGTPFAKNALTDVSFTIESGSFVGLIGATGSGKSTLIQHLNGLLKPASGDILIDGVAIGADKSALRDVRRKVGLLFQYPEHQLFEETVEKDVAFGPINCGVSEGELAERVSWALDLVGIAAELRDKSPFELSGGQKRRVALAGVLAMRPQVLILDEPAAGLDPRGRREIMNRIADMHRTLGLTIILVSHSMEEIAEYVSRVLVLSRGQIVMDDTPKSIFTRNTELEKLGLAAPQIFYAFEMLKKRGIKIDDTVFTTSQAVERILKILGR